MKNELLLKWMKLGQTTLPNCLLAYYKDLNMTNDELVTLIQLLSLAEQGQGFPDTQILSERLDVSKEDAFKAIYALISKKLITIETTANEEGKTVDTLSFDLLYEKLLLLLEDKNQEHVAIQTTLSAKELYNLFAEEFGRSLSAIEIQTLEMWLEQDKYSPELIQMALREAVLNQVYSLKYIDRILLAWEKKNIRTKEQVEKESKRHRISQSQAVINKEKLASDKPVPMYNWLKDKLEK
ncbi:DnaD domain-containing protein [Alkalibacterium sp. MB6]|uniref:DnaD domain-containing protein n=1 Tax=Alkalibacterium sp. MB6 TaxID=2081965 RepID=UPI00137A0939|nr:DnaD domain protein [Alkalibacterium sp. MB6]